MGFDDLEDDIEILDTETYRSEKNQEFSHQTLVMIAMRKVLEYACQELVAGYYNTETDIKGKTKIVYKQDTRKAFIESVRTLRMVMICDFDQSAGEKLNPSKPNDKKEIKLSEKNLIDKLILRKIYYLKEQKKWWDSLGDGQKRGMESKGLGVIEGYFNIELCFYQQYFLEELEIYREIFEELNHLTSRLKFYGKKHYESGPSSGDPNYTNKE